MLTLFNHTCAFCGVTNAMLDLEHLDALRLGGRNVPGNVVPACRPCNAQKAYRTLEEFCALRGLDASSIRAKAAQLALP